MEYGVILLLLLGICWFLVALYLKSPKPKIKTWLKTVLNRLRF